MTFDELMQRAKEAEALGDSDLQLAYLEKAQQVRLSQQSPAAPSGKREATFFEGAGQGTFDAARNAINAFPESVLPEPFRSAAWEHFNPAEQAKVNRETAPLGHTAGNIAANLWLMQQMNALQGVQGMPGIIQSFTNPRTIAGQAGGSALGGFLFSPGSTNDRLAPAALSAVTSGALNAAPYLYQAVKTKATPYLSGAVGDRLRNTSVGRFLRSVAGSSGGSVDEAITNMRNAEAPLPDYQLTVADASNNPGLASAQRGVEQFAPSDIRQTNNRAIRDAVGSIARTDADFTAAEDLRASVTGPMYETAKGVFVAVDDQLRSLLRRPSMRDALALAEKNAAEAGTPIPQDVRDAILSGQIPAQISGEGLHWLKTGLDDVVSQVPSKESGKNFIRLANDTRRAFEAWRERNIPLYNEAQRTYSDLSRPLDRMTIGRELHNKIVSPVSGEMPSGQEYLQLTPARFNAALRDAEDSANKLLDFKKARGIAEYLTPEEMQTIEGIRKAVTARTAVDNLGRGSGSDTASKLFIQRFTEQFGFPPPNSVIGNMIPGSFPANYMVSEGLQRLNLSARDRMALMLSDAFRNPQAAATLMEQATPGIPSRMWTRAGRYVPGLLSTPLTVSKEQKRER